MEIIPAIDIRGGKCVRLAQGDYSRETVFDADPVAVAVRWSQRGADRIHVVDLDGAREGRQANAGLLRRIVNSVDCKVQAGGGIRDLETLRNTLDMGVDRVVLGTAAVRDQRLLREAIAIAGPRLVVSVDAKEGRVQVEGWTEGTALDARAFIERLAGMGVQRIVYTDILRDGVEAGPNFAMYERLTSATDVAILAAGGVRNTEDIERLAGCGVEGAIIGRALYTGHVRLPDALIAAK